MGLFDKLFNKHKKSTTKATVQQKAAQNLPPIPTVNDTTVVIKEGFVSTYKIDIDNKAVESLKKRYFSFDVETTGLNPYNDRIIEVGAVLFENGVPVKKYGTLVNPKVNIPSIATSINHITNQMIENAPSEKDIYSELVNFLGDALQGKTLICAHNAKFDMDFLSQTLKRFGFDADFYYVDTLSLSRTLIKGLPNYKQETIASYFGIEYSNQHRSEVDSEVCGKVLWNLIKKKEEEIKKKKLDMQKTIPSEEEMEVCAVIQNIIMSKKGDTELLGFYKNSGGYVDVCYLYKIIRFKFARKGKYAIVSSKLKCIKDKVTEPCTVSEGGSDYVRLFFNSPLELEILEDYIFEEYLSARKSSNDYLEFYPNFFSEYKDGPIMNNALSAVDVSSVLSKIKMKEYQPQETNVDSPHIIKREDIEIHPINNRVKLKEIKNLHDWDKGFDEGYPFYEDGDNLRKTGNLLQAIELFDKARFYGYCAPALYESYAMAFHKLKDYENEIDILDEGIKRKEMQGATGLLITRRDNAIKSLVKSREKERITKEREQKKLNKIEKKESTEKKKIGRPILEMDDNMTVIERFETIAEASRKTGINSKSIRDAAKGVQKHAGSFVWRYAEENISHDSQ